MSQAPMESKKAYKFVSHHSLWHQSTWNTAETASARKGLFLAAIVMLRCYILEKYSKEILWQSLNLLIWRRISCDYSRQIFFLSILHFFV